MEESSYYIWQPPGSERAVHLSYDVIDRILQDVLRGFGSIPKRGAEVGGILLGRIADNVVEIDDVEIVSCDYRMGPSYLLTENDGKKFAEVRNRAGARTVGYFRSNTRDVLALGEEDLSLLAEHFSDPFMIALLIRPYTTKVSEAGFIFRENGEFSKQSPLEFPFSRKLLGGGARPRSAAPPIPPPPVAPKEIPVTLPPIPAVTAKEVPSYIPPSPIPMADDTRVVLPNRQSSSKGFWIAAVALSVALGWSGGYFTARKLPGPPDPNVYRLAATATSRTNDIAISWNPNAAPLRTAMRGHLTIREGEKVKTIPLDLEQLRLGHVVYRSATTPVTFDLEIEEVGGSFVRESVKFTPPPSAPR